MNILPKKSWHVRTKRNIERVRRDEAKAAEEEKELKRRIRLAEQEARTELLRKKAKSETFIVNSDIERALETSDADSSWRSSNSSGHINFFKEIENNEGYSGRVNKDHEEEEKARKEKYEKDIGLLTYLGQSSLEAKGETPWYLKSSAALLSSEGKEEIPSAKQKSRIDPLNEMNKYLSMKQKQSNGKEIYLHEKEKSSTCSTPREKESFPKKLSKIEELRAKRLKREEEEKRKSQQFLESLSKVTSKADEVILDDRARKYNSQFNPHLARNNLYAREY